MSKSNGKYSARVFFLSSDQALADADFRLGNELPGAIESKEQELRTALEAQESIEHQMRSRAILLNVDTNQKTRMNAVRGL